MNVEALREPVAPANDIRSGRLRHLDGWRGLAVLLVIAGHFFPVPGINLGTLGVELFFVLSGRLMADILFVQKFPIAAFFARRFSRVYPALLCFVIVVAIASQGTAYAIGPKGVLTALTFLFNYDLWIPSFYRTGFLDHLWSLCVEEHSYVLMGLTAIVWKRSIRSTALLATVIAGVAMIDGAISIFVLHQDYFHAYWRTDVHIASILVGSAAYLALHGDDSVPRGTLAGAIPIMSLIVGVALNADRVPLPVTYSLGTALIAVAVCTLHWSPAWLLRIFTNRGLVYVGLISYSLYLWQQPFYKLAEDGALPVPMALAIAALCALLSFYVVEGPSRRWLNALFEARRGSHLQPVNSALPGGRI